MMGVSEIHTLVERLKKWSLCVLSLGHGVKIRMQSILCTHAPTACIFLLCCKRMNAFRRMSRRESTKGMSERFTSRLVAIDSPIRYLKQRCPCLHIGVVMVI